MFIKDTFPCQPCTNVIRIQMYFFYWLYSTINLSILNKCKIERIQMLQAQYWNERTAVFQPDFSPYCSWEAFWSQILKSVQASKNPGAVKSNFQSSCGDLGILISFKLPWDIYLRCFCKCHQERGRGQSIHSRCAGLF